MTANVNKTFAKVFGQFERLGLLLVSDSSFPSISGLVTGERIVGSWWSHNQAHVIFGINEMLEDHPDVLVMKLISGKVTFVHRALWEHVYSIAVARDDWQLKKLSGSAKSLLGRLDNEARLQTDKLGKSFGAKPGDTARELELRLLIHAQQIHTKSGKHAKVLETWDNWARRVGFHIRAKSSSKAQRYLEERLASIKTSSGDCSHFPWPAELI
jgi:hypothetical protein